AWTECALATVLQNASAEDICRQWSNAADALIKSAWESVAVEDMAILALGKLGARELNLSSDIDLTIVTSEHPNEKQFFAARKFISILSEKSPFGFCFRFTMILRQGETFPLLIFSINHFQDIYWTLVIIGERSALF